MSMTLLATVQEFCDRTGLESPAAVMSSTDDQIRQLRGLANEVLTDVLNRGQSWPELQKQALFTTVAGDNQGAMTALAPYGFKYIIEDTAYDRTARRPLYGPRNSQRWQEAAALPFTGPYYSYRIWEGKFRTQTAMPAGSQIAFEYASDWAILDTDGVTWKKRFATDMDTFGLNEDLLLLGLRWKWKKEKGLSSSTEKLDYESLLAQMTGNDGTKAELNMGHSGTGDIRPGVYVPLGNWSV